MPPYSVEKAQYIASLVVPSWALLGIISGESMLFHLIAVFCLWLICKFGLSVFVLPLHNRLKANGRENLLVLLLSGFVGGVLILLGLFIIIALVSGVSTGDIEAASKGLLFGGVVGVVVSLVFCLLSGTTNLMPLEKSRVD